MIATEDSALMRGLTSAHRADGEAMPTEVWVRIANGGGIAAQARGPVRAQTVCVQSGLLRISIELRDLSSRGSGTYPARAPGPIQQGLRDLSSKGLRDLSSKGSGTYPARASLQFQIRTGSVQTRSLGAFCFTHIPVRRRSFWAGVAG